MDVRLILHADDFGLNSATTNVILACIGRGTITSVTVMTNMPGTEEALAAARRLGSRVSVGVHLNLCHGRPLTGAGTLISREGRFLTRFELVRKALAGRVDPADVDAELSAQIAQVRLAGIAISHVDSHKHVHVVPPISRVVAGLARRFGIGRVRCPARPIVRGASLSSWGTLLCRTIASRGARDCFSEAGLTSPDRFVDLRQLTTRSSGFVPERLQRIAALRNGQCVEVMCHPAAAPVGASGPASDASVLLSDAFVSSLTAARVQTCTYWDC